jgi:hypothetical protein
MLKVQAQVSEVKNIMLDSIEKVCYCVVIRRCV